MTRAESNNKIARPKPGWHERARDCSPAWQRKEWEELRGEWVPGAWQCVTDDYVLSGNVPNPRPVPDWVQSINRWTETASQSVAQKLSVILGQSVT